MITAWDILAAKVVVQLGLVPLEPVRVELRSQAAAKDDTRDVLNRLAPARRLDPKQIELVRHRVALYEHVRAEASYLRLLEKHGKVDRVAVARLLVDLEHSAYRKRLGDVLVKDGRLTKQQDAAIHERVRTGLEKEDLKIVERYVQEDFQGAGRPLIPGSRLAPDDFRISTLFRGKETRVLVKEAAESLREAEQAKTMVFDSPALLAPPPPPKGPPLPVATPPPRAPSTVTFPAVTPPPLPPPTVTIPAVTPVPATPEPDVPTFLRQSIDEGDVGTGSSDESDVAPADEAPDRTPISAKQARDPRIEALRKIRKIGAWKVEQILGVGGMGAVFLGESEGAYAAIKVMLGTVATEQERGRFLREIALTKKVKHKNVIGIIESGETPEGLTYLVVPALVGKELRAILDDAKGEGLAPAEACELFEQLLNGMAAVHAQRIVHRDLKPENVMVLGKERQVKIMDFGLAKLDDEADAEASASMFRTRKFEVLGSPAYIAPESVTRDPIDARTDIYSLGVILFEMLTGRLPIEAASPRDYLEKHLICPPLTLREARGGPGREWPPAAEDLIAKMLGKNREDRPDDCAAVLKALPAIKQQLVAMSVARPASSVGQTHGFKGLLGRLLGGK